MHLVQPPAGAFHQLPEKEHHLGSVHGVKRFRDVERHHAERAPPARIPNLLEASQLLMRIAQRGGVSEAAVGGATLLRCATGLLHALGVKDFRGVLHAWSVARCDT